MYLFSRVAGKILGIYAVSRWKNLSINVRKYLGPGMLVQAGVAIGLVDIVRSADKELADIIAPIILSTIVIYETVGPPIIRFVLFKAGEAVSTSD